MDIHSPSSFQFLHIFGFYSQNCGRLTGLLGGENYKSFDIKGTVSVISSDLPCKGFIIVNMGEKYFIKITFKSTVVNRALSALHGGLFETTLTVPFSIKE